MPDRGAKKLRENAPASGRWQAEACPTIACKRLAGGGGGGFACELFPAFVHNLDGIHHGILPSRDETENELALGVRLQALERLVESAKAARFPEDVEVPQQDKRKDRKIDRSPSQAKNSLLD